MNCACGRPAVVRTVSKPGENQGKQFFTCDSNNKCNFFCWVGGKPTLSIKNQIPRPSSSRNVSSSPSKKSPHAISVRLSVHSFDDSSSFKRIWFSAMIVGQNSSLTKFIVSIPDHQRKYLDRIKLWIFSFDIYEFFVCTMNSTEFSNIIDLVELPRFLVRGLKSYLRSLPEIDPNDESILDLNIGATLQDTLLPFQIDGVKFVIKHGGRAMIADEMGCGKTLQAIAIIQHYKKYWPALILVPPNLVVQWRGELLAYNEELNENDIFVIRKSTDTPYGKIILAPYSLLDKLVEKDKLMPEKYGIVVCDESHHLKSKDAKRTNNALPFLKTANVALCLTGTPATNRPEELYTQLNGLRPEIFNDYEAFTIRYCNAKEGRFGWDTKGSSNEAELKLLLEGCVMIRRLKSDVVKGLPTKSRIVRYVSVDAGKLEELQKKQREAKSIDAAMKDPYIDDVTLRQLKSQAQVLLNTQYQLSGICKIQGVISELSKLIEEARVERAIAEEAEDRNTGHHSHHHNGVGTADSDDDYDSLDDLDQIGDVYDKRSSDVMKLRGDQKVETEGLGEITMEVGCEMMSIDTVDNNDRKQTDQSALDPSISTIKTAVSLQDPTTLRDPKVHISTEIIDTVSSVCEDQTHLHHGNRAISSEEHNRKTSAVKPTDSFGFGFGVEVDGILISDELIEVDVMAENANKTQSQSQTCKDLEPVEVSKDVVMKSASTAGSVSTISHLSSSTSSPEIVKAGASALKAAIQPITIEEDGDGDSGVDCDMGGNGKGEGEGDGLVDSDEYEDARHGYASLDQTPERKRLRKINNQIHPQSQQEQLKQQSQHQRLQPQRRSPRILQLSKDTADKMNAEAVVDLTQVVDKTSDSDSDSLCDSLEEDQLGGRDIFFLNEPKHDRSPPFRRRLRRKNDVFEGRKGDDTTKGRSVSPVFQGKEEDIVDIWRTILPGKPKVEIKENVIESEEKDVFKEDSSSTKKTSKKRTRKSQTKEKDSIFNGTPEKKYRGLGRKILVFAHHNAVLNSLERCLRSLDVTFIRVDGQVPTAARGGLIRKFQMDDETDVALLSLSACGTGLNLTRANVAVFAELAWSAGLILQAEDRIHRIGQSSKSVRIIYLIGKGTADEIVWEQIQKKHNMLELTVGIDNRTIDRISEQTNSHSQDNNNNNNTTRTGNTKISTSSGPMDTFLRNGSNLPNTDLCSRDHSKDILKENFKNDNRNDIIDTSGAQQVSTVIPITTNRSFQVESDKITKQTLLNFSVTKSNSIAYNSGGICGKMASESANIELSKTPIAPSSNIDPMKVQNSDVSMNSGSNVVSSSSTISNPNNKGFTVNPSPYSNSIPVVMVQSNNKPLHTHTKSVETRASSVVMDPCQRTQPPQPSTNTSMITSNTSVYNCTPAQPSSSINKAKPFSMLPRWDIPVTIPHDPSSSPPISHRPVSGSVSSSFSSVYSNVSNVKSAVSSDRNMSFNSSLKDASQNSEMIGSLQINNHAAATVSNLIGHPILVTNSEAQDVHINPLKNQSREFIYDSQSQNSQNSQPTNLSTSTYLPLLTGANMVLNGGPPPHQKKIHPTPTPYAPMKYPDNKVPEQPFSSYAQPVSTNQIGYNGQVPQPKPIHTLNQPSYDLGFNNNHISKDSIPQYPQKQHPNSAYPPSANPHKLLPTQIGNAASERYGYLPASNAKPTNRVDVNRSCYNTMAQEQRRFGDTMRSTSPKNSTGHVFSTGTGKTKINVSNEAIQQAEGILCEKYHNSQSTQAQRQAQSGTSLASWKRKEDGSKEGVPNEFNPNTTPFSMTSKTSTTAPTSTAITTTVAIPAATATITTATAMATTITTTTAAAAMATTSKYLPQSHMFSPSKQTSQRISSGVKVTDGSVSRAAQPYQSIIIHNSGDIYNQPKQQNAQQQQQQQQQQGIGNQSDTAPVVRNIPLMPARDSNRESGVASLAYQSNSNHHPVRAISSSPAVLTPSNLQPLQTVNNVSSSCSSSHNSSKRSID